jgi:uncharacterized membrane protein
MKAIILAVCAGLCWGVGELFTKSVLHTHKVGPITAIAVRSTVALPVLWIAYFVAVKLAKAEPADWYRAGTPTLLKLVCGSGLIAGAAAMICFYAALNFGEVSRVKPIAFALAPAVASVLAFTLLGEPLTAKKALGIAAILGGVVLLTGK